jgi:hypothetical protein
VRACPQAGDLFDFDAEVVPILEVLVGKTLESAFMEVSQGAQGVCMRSVHACGGLTCGPMFQVCMRLVCVVNRG